MIDGLCKFKFENLKSMILLRQVEGKTKSNFNLLCNKTYTIGNGKADVELKIQSDLSISRKHASISVESTDQSTNNIQCTLADLGSKHGTFIEVDGTFQAVTADQPRILEIGSRIKFGIATIFEVIHVPIKIAVSSLPDNLKRMMLPYLSLLNGEVSSKWTDDCTALVMNQIMLTIKVGTVID
ncbi:nibrin-like [Artemia franciscana]|uniref:nibrin-like n=1 Tax=Artemia franciscana TaxID=6661 RepID=UPI0032DA6EBA